jgi:hypothetical protein
MPFPLPKIAKGVIVCIDSERKKLTYIVLQYNPESLTRNITPKVCDRSEGQGKCETMRITGAPDETITLNVKINAADQLANGNLGQNYRGIYPQISALELLVYPNLASVDETESLLKQGKIEIFSVPAPLTLFQWGKNRIVPVKITSLNINEDLHDTDLNPISAQVNITMKVLSYNDLPSDNNGYNLFKEYQRNMESKAENGRKKGQFKERLTKEDIINLSLG